MNKAGAAVIIIVAILAVGFICVKSYRKFNPAPPAPVPGMEQMDPSMMPYPGMVPPGQTPAPKPATAPSK